MADKVDLATVAYMLGMLSIVFAFFSPFAGLVLGLIGFSQSKKEKANRARSLNKIGIILSIILIVISGIALFYSVKNGLDSGITNIIP